MAFKNLALTAAFLFCALLGYAQDVRVIVSFNGDADGGTFEKHGGTVKVSGDGFVAGNINAGKLGALRREKNVASIEEDRIVTIHTQTVDWGVARINAPNATYTGSYVNPADSSLVRVRVAVLDTGIDTDHPGLTGQWEVGKNCTTDYGSDTGNIEDGQGHGTHVSGTVAELNDTEGRVGVAHGAIVRVYKVLRNGDGAGYTSWIIDGLNTASADGCRVFNMSYGSRFSSSSESTAINNAWNNGVVLCGAAGNDGTKNYNYPGAYTNVIAVCASTSLNKRASFSQYGTWCDITCPGVGITSTTNNGGYASWSGTSMATPHCSGAAAAIWSKLLGTSDPNATNAEVRRRIELKKNNIIDSKKWTPGILDLNRALSGQ